MVRFEAPVFIGVVAIVWVVWRLIVWRRKGVDLARELVVAALFGWLIVVFYFTFFPMTIIFYSWHGRINLIPFASIVQLVRETSSGLASYNIVGNLLLLAPLGILLPLLFEKLQRPWPIIWRAAAISMFIEASQFVTRARAVDVDDVILNTAGAAVGFGTYRFLVAMLERSSAASRVLDRVGISTTREPLLLAATPLVASTALVASFMMYSIVGATLGGGAGIANHATESVAGSEVVAQFDVNEYTLIVVESSANQRSKVGMWMYQKVLPGRYTWILSSDHSPLRGSGYTSAITAWNPGAGEIPTLYVWGRNEDGAATIVIDGRVDHEEVPIDDGPYFAAGFYYEPDPTAGVLETFTFRFLDADGQDISAQFVDWNE